MDLLSQDGGKSVKITGIVPQSQAEKKGVRVGDVPVHVATSDKIPYSDFVRSAQTVRPLIFSVLRENTKEIST